MTHKVENFRKCLSGFLDGTEGRFVTKFGENRLLRSLRKVAWITTKNKLAIREYSS